MVKKTIIGAVAAFGAFGLTAAHASVWLMTTTNNASGNPVSAKATITNVGDLLTVSLENLSPSLKAANQGLSGIFIDFAVDPTTTSAFTQSGALETITAGNGTKTLISGSPTHWGRSMVSGELFINTLTGGAPFNLIAPATIGPTQNASVVLASRQPWIDKTATFALKLGGLTGPVVTRVRFNFGTERGEFIGNSYCSEGCSTATPEPATWAMMILGFGAVGGMLRRRRAAVA